MTTNDRPVNNPRLQRALEDVKAVFARYGFAGCAMVIDPQEAAFVYAMHAPWSALRFDPDSPLGWRFSARSQRDGAALTYGRVEAAMHTICQLSDFGDQTTMWMEDMKLMLRRAGIEFEHTKFGGRPPPHLDQMGQMGQMGGQMGGRKGPEAGETGAS